MTMLRTPLQRCAAAVLAAFCLLAFFAAPDARAQSGEITGVVTDSTSGATIPGVNVVVVGSSVGASTGIDGNYTISGLEPGTYTLRATFVGYQASERPGVTVEAGETTEVDFALAEQSVGLDEVVVVGYGEQDARDVTGSIASVSGEEIAEVPVPSVTQALQGRVAGVQITPAGEPGGEATVRIRGVGTLGDPDPLYVVDGMLTDDISFLNTNNIESIEVLKDASATAIYGSRGANGVVVVTTKRGSARQGATFTADVAYGWQDVPNQIDLVGPRQYAILANELASNVGTQQPFANPQQITEGTNWQDQVFQVSPLQNYQLGARGGTEDITYNFSGSFISQDGILRGSTFDEATFRANSSFALNDAIELGQNLTFQYRQGQGAAGGLVSSAYAADPTVLPRNAEGDFNDAGVRASTGNPAASIFYNRGEFDGRRLVGNVYAEGSFLDHFTVRSSFGVDVNYSNARDFTPQFFVSPQQQAERSALRIEQQETENWLWENTVTYDQTLGDHSFDVLGGITAQANRFESIGGTRNNIIGEDESLWYLGAGDSETQTNFNSATDWSMISYLGRVNYQFRGRYLLTATMRADGSSRFGAENRFGYFPALGLGWRLSDEPFMSDVDFLSNLKLRGSWGIVGNDKIGLYRYVATVSGNQNAVFGGAENLEYGATQTALANPEIQWEEARQLDVGFEGGLFDERITVVFDYYRRNTDGILTTVPIPEYVGAGAPVVNAASVINSGFELALNFDGSIGAVQYGIGANGTTINNEVTSLGTGHEAIFAGDVSGEVAATTRTAPGRPIGQFFGYEVVGVFQNEEEIANLPNRGGEEPGDLIYADTNNDGVITSDDRTYLGSSIPTYSLGFTLDMRYRGFDLSANVTAQGGNLIYNAKKSSRFGIDNFETSYLDRWTGPGTSNTEPRLTNSGHNYLASDRFLEDGSFLKIQNVQIGYTLPARLTNSVGANRLRAYVGGTNLLILTGYSGYSPENVTSGDVLAPALDEGGYPLARTITVGVNLSL